MLKGTLCQDSLCHSSYFCVCLKISVRLRRRENEGSRGRERNQRGKQISGGSTILWKLSGNISNTPPKTQGKIKVHLLYSQQQSTQKTSVTPRGMGISLHYQGINFATYISSTSPNSVFTMKLIYWTTASDVSVQGCRPTSRSPSLDADHKPCAILPVFLPLPITWGSHLLADHKRYYKEQLQRWVMEERVIPSLGLPPSGKLYSQLLGALQTLSRWIFRRTLLHTHEWLTHWSPA